MISPLKIAVVYPTSLPWMAEILDGIRRYGRQFGGWQILTCPPSLAASGEPSRTLRSLVGWNGDAAIAAVRSVEERKVIRQLGFPVVNISNWEADTHGLPRVSVDNVIAGRFAADHLMAQGLKHFGFVGWSHVHYSDQRRLGFSQRAQEAGFPCEVKLDVPGESGDRTLAGELHHLGAWLKTLPIPCGIFAVHDYRAQMVMEACAAVGLRVPKDVAVIGMDNDAIICEHSVPTLTSVCRNSNQVGWEAAALIHRLLQGEDAGATEILVPPEGITERQSTDRFHHDDEVIQLAIHFMLSNLREPPKIETVARHSGVSKRTLEMRFKACTGMSPHRFLRDARIEHAKKLIQRPAKPSLRTIASECGFSSYPTFIAAFQSVSGESPGAYQNEVRNASGS